MFRRNSFRADLLCNPQTQLELWFQTAAHRSPYYWAGWTNVDFFPQGQQNLAHWFPSCQQPNWSFSQAAWETLIPEPQMFAVENCLFSSMPWGLVKPLSSAPGVNVQSQKWPHLTIHPGEWAILKSLVSQLESHCLSLGLMVKNSWLFSKEKKNA